MNRILMSLAIVAVAGVIVSIGATGAFFSDTETSTGNTFTAGAIDLKIDNESYYNGLANASTTWALADLTIQKFFNFSDLKPSDYGEDTVSVHVDTNDSYICADVTLTSNNDNTQTEPESAVDGNGLATGELAGQVNFIWWADDGDNVLESGENVISSGPIGALPLNQPYHLTLADSSKNIWNPAQAAGPVAGLATKYIGKAWCFGAIAAAPIAQDGSGTLRSPAGNNDGNLPAGQPTDGGITCNGAAIGNEAQTDSLTADVSFTAVQSRNNSAFLCTPNQQACVPSSTNLLVDGSFESPTVVSGDLWDIFPSPAGGWNIAWRADVPASFGSGIRPVIANLELHKGVLGVAHGGNQYVELDSDWDGHANTLTGEPAATVISKVITTIPGATYTVDYWFAPRPNTVAANNKVEARVNGVLVNTAGPLAGGGGNLTAGSWIHQIASPFLATSTSAVISFTDAGTADSLGTFVDDMAITLTSCTLPQ